MCGEVWRWRVVAVVRESAAPSPHMAVATSGWWSVGSNRATGTGEAGGDGGSGGGGSNDRVTCVGVGCGVCVARVHHRRRLRCGSDYSGSSCGW